MQLGRQSDNQSVSYLVSQSVSQLSSYGNHVASNMFEQNLCSTGILRLPPRSYNHLGKVYLIDREENGVATLECENGKRTKVQTRALMDFQSSTPNSPSQTWSPFQHESKCWRKQPLICCAFVPYYLLVAYVDEYQHRALKQGCTNSGCEVFVATTFCMVAPNICGSLAWNFLHVTHL